MDFLSLLAPPKVTRSLLTSPSSLFSAALSLRIVLLLYGLYQDAHGPLKYTDIDYGVFTDAARYISYGHSPYLRDTYRYTPLLAWILLPTTWEPQHIWFSFGKALFAISDILAGWMIFVVLQKRGTSQMRALKYSGIWLLNPMVATISTRGSSEGLLCVMVMALLWATEMRHIALSGVLLGLAVHFKIYPFIYGVSILWSLEPPAPNPSRPAVKEETHTSIFSKLSTFLNQDRLVFIFTSLATFSALNISMFALYGTPFMQHTYLHHLTRIDHRHNFSPYNILLYLSSANIVTTAHLSSLRFESLAFIPQLVLSTLLIPVSISNSSLPRAMLAQTFAFVTFNKVCTSQYFLWYLIFLPIYLPDSVLIRNPTLGFSVLGAWVAGQTVWLWQGYKLEMLGESSFVPGLWSSSLLFFAVNCWILGIVISDHGPGGHGLGPAPEKGHHKVDTIYPREKTLKEEGVRGVEDDSDEESDVEEIPREQTVEEMVREEMKRRRQYARTGVDSTASDRQQTDVLLGEYMDDIQSLISPDE
ncbi:GPI mannosyltransferase 1 [Endocarpon pusillum]|uniref:GPI mannosyltransferase 1 n=1 Tax=Endocarpon pusillum TaxID=364733 RepID=A0A8H7ALR9_9EURO|nr:GPI mannosyltransferase 1 [Endocarpon pusillum]